MPGDAIILTEKKWFHIRNIKYRSNYEYFCQKLSRPPQVENLCRRLSLLPRAFFAKKLKPVAARKFPTCSLMCRYVRFLQAGFCSGEVDNDRLCRVNQSAAFDGVPCSGKLWYYQDLVFRPSDVFRHAWPTRTSAFVARRSGALNWHHCVVVNNHCAVVELVHNRSLVSFR